MPLHLLILSFCSLVTVTLYRATVLIRPLVLHLSLPILGFVTFLWGGHCFDATCHCPNFSHLNPEGGGCIFLENVDIHPLDSAV
jgi:hypothetical protein